MWDPMQGGIKGNADGLSHFSESQYERFSFTDTCECL